MTLTFICLSILKVFIVHPIESVAAIAALITGSSWDNVRIRFLNSFLIRRVIYFWTRSESKLQDAQRKRKRRLALKKRARMEQVQAQLNALTFEDCSRQELSPLFSVLPGELRNEVFRWTLVQYEDESAAYSEDSYWYRPGFHGPKRSSDALLRTCKRIYLEARRVVMREAEHAFWFNRGPEGRTGFLDFERFFDKLTAQNVEDLTAVRLFTQMYWLEGGFLLHRAMQQTNFAPERLTITIRYTDWWFWENNEPLRMGEGWLKKFFGPPSLRELVVEYETIAWKRDEMMRIIERNKKWKLDLRDAAGHLSAEGTPLKEWRWQGSSRFAGGSWSHHGPADKIDYVVVEDRWTWRPGVIAEGDRARKINDNAPSNANGPSALDVFRHINGDSDGDGADGDEDSEDSADGDEDSDDTMDYGGSDEEDGIASDDNELDGPHDTSAQI